MAKFSFNVAWTPFSMLNSFTDVNFQLINAHVRAKSSKMEAEALKLTEQWEAEADLIGSPQASLEMLTARSNAFAEAAVKEWWKFTFDTFIMFGHYMRTDNDTQTGVDWFAQTYPDWWLQSRDVGYTTWSKHGDAASAEPDLSSSRLALVEASATPQSALPLSTVLLSVACAFACAAAAASMAYFAGLREGRRRAGEADAYVACP